MSDTTAKTMAGIGRLHPADRAAIEESLALVRDSDAASVLASMAPRLGTDQRAALAEHCELTQVGVLVFPTSTAQLVAELRADGLYVDDAVADVLVRDRLARRHGIDADRLDVSTVRVREVAPDQGPRAVELFSAAPLPDSEWAAIVERERRVRHDFHFALDARTPDDVVVAGLRALLVDEGGLVADGGRYDPSEDRTTLFFRSPAGMGGCRRLALRMRGHAGAALRAHGAAAPDESGKRLLELLIGAWTTQAIAVAAELGLPDAMADAGSPSSAAELAAGLVVDPDGLARLLRYLASLGLVDRVGDKYALTALGDALRAAARHSMRPLALLYGGPFYQSFAALAHAVRTGREGFETVYGKGHFDYFAEHPPLASLFDAAMAASAPMFEPVAELIDFADAAVVVDIAGGTGELLSRVLRHRDDLRGVLLERAHVLDRAWERLAGDGLAHRCDLVAGDFTRSVPAGGDIYLLSRVLHDWDDQQCRTILGRCAESIRPGAQLLIVERLLPDDDTRSLAVAWDLHMLCNVGGRERSAAHYARLLAETGFELTDVSALPLDGSLLHARRLPPVDRAGR